MSNRFGKNCRLLCARDYREVFNDATFRTGQREFLLLARGNDTGQHRLGLAVAKKHVRLATQRNRIKRGAREAFRQLPDSLPGLDIIFLTRPGAASMDTAIFTRDLPQQFARLCRNSSRESDSAA